MNQTSGSNHDANPLVALFHHNLWANLRLFEVCAGLTPEQLAASDPGAFGTVRATLEHIVRSERYYVWLLQGQPGDYQRVDMAPLTVAEMCALVQESGERLIDLAADAGALDPVAVTWDNQPWSIPAPFILTQAINHATEHRTNITTILAALGVQNPDLDGWDYFLATHSKESAVPDR
jgi:uncharacterized damage-inducible protein DinB